MTVITPVMAQAMKALGWDLDSDFPMANEENLRLLEEIEQMTLEKQNLQVVEDELTERIKKVESHVKNATATIQHNTVLLNAFQKDVIDEEHNVKVVTRERSKLLDDIKMVTKENEHFKTFTSKIEGEITKLHKKMEDETARIQWAKTALIEWQQAMEEGNKGYQLIEKYFKADQQKAFEADLRRKNLEKEINKVRKEVINLYDEQKNLESGIESTANLYRTAHHDRREMIDTWKAAVKLMTERERSIIEGEQKLAQFQAALKKKQDAMAAYDKKLNDIIKSNRDIEREMEDLNKQAAFLRDEFQSTIDQIKIKEQEIVILEIDLENLCHAIENQRMKNKHLRQARLLKWNEIKRMSQANERLKNRADNIRQQTMDSAQRLQLVEELIDNEEKLNAKCAKDTGELNQLLFRAQTQQAELKSEEKIEKVSGDSIKSTIGTVGKKILDLEKDLKHLSEASYDLDFKLLDMERNIIERQGGVIDPEEEKKYGAYLAELDETFIKLQHTLHVTEFQNKKLNENMRTLTMSYNKDMINLEQIQSQIKEAESYCEGGKKLLKSEQSQYQSMIVELAILRMKANEFEKIISETKDKVYNLEKHRLGLSKMIKDRMVEIKSQTELLNLKKKHLNEEKSTLRADLGERKKHIEAMKARFELQAQLLGTNEDGSLVTATQLRVQSVQEKQILLEEGNALNEKVIKAEKDIKAMENTVNLINYFNDSYRSKVMVNSKEEDGNKQQLEQLRAEHCEAVETLKILRQQAEKIVRLIEKALTEKEKLEKTIESEKIRKEELLEALGKLRKEIADQLPKIQRAERELTKVLKNVRKLPIGEGFLALYEKDVELKDLESRNMKALNHLCDLVEHNETYGPKIMEIMTKRGFKMAHQIRRGRGFALSSTTSDMTLSSSRSYGEDSMTDRSTFSAHSLQLKSASLSVVSLDFPPSSQ